MHRCRRRTLQQKLCDLAEERDNITKDMGNVKQALDELDGGIMILRDSKAAIFITPVKEKP